MDNMEMLKQFEIVLKKCLKEYFGSFLSQNKQVTLDSKSYVNEEDIKALNSREEIQGYILRNMINDIINISYVNHENNAKFGEYIESLVREYYAKSISVIYKFDIDTKIKDEKNVVGFLKSKLDTNFDNYMLNSDLSKIINIQGMEQLKSFINIEISKPEKVLNEYIKDDGTIQIVEIDNTKYLKYIDSNNKVITNKILNNRLELYFNDRIANLAPEVALSSEILYKELMEIINIVNEGPIVNDDIFNKNKTNHETHMEEENNTSLSPEQYEELCLKYANGERLSKEEMDLLINSAPEIAENINYDKELNLGMSNSRTSGKITNSLIFYIIELGSLFGILLYLIYIVNK